MKALQTDPRVFGSNYEKESQMTEADWRSRLQAKDNAVFLVSYTHLAMRMTPVAVDRDDPTKKTGLLWGSWLAPHFRGKGLSELMYQTRIKWAKEQPIV